MREDRRTIGYIYGGTREERMHEYEMLKKKFNCYMRLASPKRKKKVIDYIRNEHSGNGIIISLNKSGRVFELVS